VEIAVHCNLMDQIEKSAAELQQFKDLKFGGGPPPWISGGFQSLCVLRGQITHQHSKFE